MMNASSWSELTASYGSAFRARVAPVRQLLPAVLDLHRRLTQPPLSIAAPYTLTPEDSGRILYLENSGTAGIVIPSGLPAHFRVSLRSLSGDPGLIATAGPELTFHHGAAGTSGDTTCLLLPNGSADLAIGPDGVVHLHGHTGEIA